MALLGPRCLAQIRFNPRGATSSIDSVGWAILVCHDGGAWATDARVSECPTGVACNALFESSAQPKQTRFNKAKLENHILYNYMAVFLGWGCLLQHISIAKPLWLLVFFGALGLRGS